MEATILGWTWWVFYFITCCVAKGPLVGRSTSQGDKREPNKYRETTMCHFVGP